MNKSNDKLRTFETFLYYYTKNISFTIHFTQAQNRLCITLNSRSQILYANYIIILPITTRIWLLNSMIIDQIWSLV